MRYRLYDLFIVDRAARVKMYVVTWVVSFSFGILLMLSGTSVEQSAVGSSLLTLVMLSTWTLALCAVPHRISRASLPTHLDRRIALATVFFAFAAALGFSTRRLEAAILDRRLLRLTRNSTLSPTEAEQVADGLDTAKKEGLHLRPSTKLRLRDLIKTSALQDPRPPFTDAATALVNYVREVNEALHIPTEAALAMDSAARHGMVAIRFVPLGDVAQLQFDRSEVEAAISDLTHAIELSGSETTLRSDALMLRAQFHSFLGQSDETLMDLHAAEKLGAADLSEIVSIEASVLITRGSTDDLRGAIQLLTLALQLPVPKLVVGNLASALIYRLDLYEQRSLAHFRLGQYSETVDDCKAIFDILKQSPPSIPPDIFPYILAMRSYLYLADIAGALTVTNEWEQRTNDPRAAQIRELVQSSPSEAQKALEAFYPLSKVMQKLQ